MILKYLIYMVVAAVMSAGAAQAQSRGGWEDFAAAVAMRESSGNQRVVNPYGYAGLYQMGTAALIDAGYIKAGTPSKSNASMNDASVWTGKNGITSVSQYLDSKEAQQNAWETYQAKNWQTMQSLGVTSYAGKTMADGTIVTDSGLIFASQFGVGKVQAYLQNGGNCIEGKGTATNDGNGICVSEYMRRGAGYDVSSFTKKAEDLSKFTAQATTDTGNADGKNAAQQGASVGAGENKYDVGCWPCHLLQPVATALDQVAARGDEFAAKYGIMIATLISCFALLWFIGAATLGILDSWRKVAAILTGLVVVVTLLSSRGWLWSEIGSPIYSGVVAVGGMIAAPGGSCSGSAATDGATDVRLTDESSYAIARLLQSGDTLGGSGTGAAPDSSGGKAGARGSGNATGTISTIVPAAKCNIESAIAAPNMIVSNLWWAVEQKVGSYSWTGMPNVPTILQFIGFGIVYLAFSGLLAWIYIASIAEVAIGVALLPICLPAALLPRSRPMVWMTVKMVAAPAATLAIVGVVSAAIAVAMAEAMQASGVAMTDGSLQDVLRQGSLPLKAWLTAVGALVIGSLLALRARAWADALTSWLGLPSPSTAGTGQQLMSLGRQSAQHTTQVVRVAGAGVGAGVSYIRSRL